VPVSTSAEQIDDALRFIPANDRDIWVKVGMAIKSELGETGYSIWDYWSQGASNYQERAAQLVWRSFKAGRTRIGTLFHIAKEHGYRYGVSAPVRRIPETEPPIPQRSTGKYAAEIWLRADCSDDAVKSHPYASAKGIYWAAGAGRATASGRVIGKDADCIVVPIRNIATNKVAGVQCINERGGKQTFGPVSGNGLVLGNTLDKSLFWCVCEGWASGVSMAFHHMNGNGVAGIAFGKSNMDRLAQTMAAIYHPDIIRILEEQDGH
jgi:putative DNA primase/helicase